LAFAVFVSIFSTNFVLKQINRTVVLVHTLGTSLKKKAKVFSKQCLHSFN
jgi:hypothetical protein